MARHKIVIDTGPLIYLSILNRFSLLKELFEEIYIPEAVYQEIVIQGAGLPGAEEANAALEEGWIQRAAIQNRVAVNALLDELDVGEAEAIVLARELDIGRVLLDDRAARTKAKVMGLSISGTIGVLLLARQVGVEVDLKRDLDVLIQSNFRISQDLYQAFISGQVKEAEDLP